MKLLSWLAAVVMVLACAPASADAATVKPPFDRGRRCTGASFKHILATVPGIDYHCTNSNEARLGSLMTTQVTGYSVGVLFFSVASANVADFSFVQQDFRATRTGYVNASASVSGLTTSPLVFSSHVCVRMAVNYQWRYGCHGQTEASAGDTVTASVILYSENGQAISGVCPLIYHLCAQAPRRTTATVTSIAFSQS